MKLSREQEEVQTMLKDTVRLAFKNCLQYSSGFSVEALIGVTIDDKDLFLISMNEIVQKVSDAEISANESSRVEITKSYKSPEQNTQQQTKNSKRKRKRHKKCESSSDGDTASEFEPSASSEIAAVVEEPSSKPASSLLMSCDSERDEMESIQSREGIMRIKEEIPMSSWMATNQYCDGHFETMLQTPDAGGGGGEQLLDPSTRMMGMSNSTASTSGNMSLSPQKSQTRGLLESISMDLLSSESIEGEADQETLSGQSLNISASVSKQHRTSHKMSNKSQLCNLCGLSFKQRAHLKEHISNVHNKDGRFVCQVDGCNKSFSREWSLESHMNVHSGVKPYQCSLCSRFFAGKYSCREHEKICQKGKTLRCDQCDQTFAGMSMLSEHKKAKHENTVFACQCGKTYSWRSGLARHKAECGSGEASHTSSQS